ncbi:metallophosphoesterase [Francisella tularensis subsp. novicida FTG]|nr:metallophosphoesterase [Francisella tularensis subsp. novicida FTG]
MCLGDLLTYGFQPNEVIQEIVDFSNTVNCIFIKGNHDQFYFDLQANKAVLNYNMPEFVRESVEWTLSELDYNLADIFKWNESFVYEKIFFAHANAFEYGDWRYLNDLFFIKQNAIRINELNCQVGFFGHTHRQKNYKMNNSRIVSECFEKEIGILNDELYILNPGSVGQPRGTFPGLAIIDFNDDFNEITVNFLDIDVDVDMVVRDIDLSFFSDMTKKKLKSYWEGLWQ